MCDNHMWLGGRRGLYGGGPCRDGMFYTWLWCVTWRGEGAVWRRPMQGWNVLYLVVMCDLEGGGGCMEEAHAGMECFIPGCDVWLGGGRGLYGGGPCRDGMFYTWLWCVITTCDLEGEGAVWRRPMQGWNVLYLVLMCDNQVRWWGRLFGQGPWGDSVYKTWCVMYSTHVWLWGGRYGGGPWRDSVCYTWCVNCDT